MAAESVFRKAGGGAAADGGGYPSEKRTCPSVCWVLINTSHYHNARMAAFAASVPATASIIELRDTDGFRALELERGRESGYQRYTLFPGVPSDEVFYKPIRKRLREKLDELRPDVVCVNGWSLPGSLEALGWCLDSGTPVVLMSESTAQDAPRNGWREMIKGRIVRLAGAALVGGAPHVGYLTGLRFPKRCILTGYDVVDNAHFRLGADAARSQQREIRHNLQLYRNYFLASSRFEPKKNLARLLKAYASYRAIAGPVPWDLVLLGDGLLKEEIQQLTNELGLEGSVLLPGFTQYDELPSYYGLAGAFVHASTTEQWGLVVNEAMAAGLPVIVSNRCGCAPDLVEDGRNGFTFDPYNVEELATLMLKVASMDATDRQAMGRASCEIISRWAPETFAENLMKAVDVALAAPRPKATLVDKALLWTLMHRPQ